ncbi:MAG: hypothetical protein QM571_06050 [Micrococcaceae bacterium]
MITLINNWLPNVWIWVAGLVLLYLPGVIVGATLRLEKIYIVFLAPVFSISFTSISTVFAHALNIRWHWWTNLPLAAITALLIIVIRAVKKSRKENLILLNQVGHQTPLKQLKYLTASIIIGVSLNTVNLIRVIGDPKTPVLSWDGLFHQNAVRFILETGSASPLTISSFQTSGKDSGFYPSVFHSYVAQIIDLTHTQLDVAFNTFTVIMGGILWPIGMIFLIYTLFPNKRQLWIVAAILTSAFPVYPYFLLAWGGLMPNILGITFIPIILTFTYALVRNPSNIYFSKVQVFVLLLLSLLAGSFSHPNTPFSAFILALPLIVEHSINLIKQPNKVKNKIVNLVLVLSFWIVLILAWHTLSVTSVWDARNTLGKTFSIWFLQTFAPLGVQAAAIAVLIGMILALFKPKWRFLSFGHLTAGYFFILAMGVHKGPYRNALTAIWYSDANRLAALSVILSIPLCCLLINEIVAKLPTNTGKLVLAFFTISSLIFGAESSATNKAFKQIHQSTYQVSNSQPLMDANKLAIIQDLTKNVPEGTLIANNPYNGGGIAYALSGRKVLFPMFNRPFMDDNERIIATSLNQAAITPGVCDALEQKNVKYALDFGTKYDAQDPAPNNPSGPDFTGLQNLDSYPGMQLIDQKGEAKLYKITACDITSYSTQYLYQTPYAYQ